MNKLREASDSIMIALRRELDKDPGRNSRFPLDSAVQLIRATRLGQVPSQGIASPDLFGLAKEKGVAELLCLFEVTSVSAALAIKRFSDAANDSSGIRDALVDLWTRAEAARGLLFDLVELWSGAEQRERREDVLETARLLAPEAIAIAMRLAEPVSKYVEFASVTAQQLR